MSGADAVPDVPVCCVGAHFQILAVDWDTFQVTGPHAFTDLRGRTWFDYRASVQSRPMDRATPGRR
jgi:hypothetical protein